MEVRADRFAFEHMPSNLKGWSHMATNQIIQDLVRLAKEWSRTRGDQAEHIVVHESAYGHPNLLSRAYALKEAAGAVDFLLEQYEAETLLDYTTGISFSGICSLAKAKRSSGVPWLIKTPPGKRNEH
jgi:hypothetical protein